MCLLFFNYTVAPHFSLSIAANRDEFVDRPTAALDYIDPERTIIGGRDLRGGGTWMGVSSGGRFAALTNFRQGVSNCDDCISRGEIVTSFLQSSASSKDYVIELAGNPGRYNGFNLICWDGRELYYYSNKGREPWRLPSGFYALSNNFINVSWPKVIVGKRLLQPILTKNISLAEKLRRPDEVFAILRNREFPKDNSLPDTGVGLEWERKLSTIFIDSPGYGTRSSSVVFITDREAVFHEASYRRETSPYTIDFRKMVLPVKLIEGNT